MIGYEPPPPGHIVPQPKAAGPVIDRLWLFPSRRGQAPTGGRPMPTGGGYPVPTRPGTAGVPDAGPYYYVKAATIALVAAVTVVGVMWHRRRSAPSQRLGVSRGEITTADALRKRLQAARRSFKKMFGYTTRGDVDAEFFKLRRRLDDLSSASSGFFPEANDMNDAALRDLLAERDAAYADARTRLDEARREATIEAREVRRRARPWET